MSEWHVQCSLQPAACGLVPSCCTHALANRHRCPSASFAARPRFGLCPACWTGRNPSKHLTVIHTANKCKLEVFCAGGGAASHKRDWGGRLSLPDAERPLEQQMTE